MPADVTDPTPLDEAIWSLYLSTVEGDVAPDLRTLAWHIAHWAGALFPVRLRRLSKRLYRKRHPDKRRASSKRHKARLREEQPERWRAMRKAKSPEARARKTKAKNAARKRRRQNDPAYREACNVKARVRVNERYATDEAYREKCKAAVRARSARKRAEELAAEGGARP